MKITVSMFEDELYPVYGFKPDSIYTHPRDIKTIEYEDYLTGMIYENLSYDATFFLEQLYNS